MVALVGDRQPVGYLLFMVVQEDILQEKLPLGLILEVRVEHQLLVELVVILVMLVVL